LAAPIGQSHRKYVSIDMRARESALESKRYPSATAISDPETYVTTSIFRYG
jgi:hypothetical protein